MSEPGKNVEVIPIDRITVLNPRVRNKRNFEEMVESIPVSYTHLTLPTIA